VPEDTDTWRARVNLEINVLVPQNAAKLSSSEGMCFFVGKLVTKMAHFL
jgi:uncharacterized metal-binding protein